MFETIGSGHKHLWEQQRSLVISEMALYWGIIISFAIDHRDVNLHLGMIMSERIFVEAYHFDWFFFTLGHALSLDEVRNSLHITMMTLRSEDSFWLEMYGWLYSSHWRLLWRCLHSGIAHSLVMDYVRWRFMPDTNFLDIILHWGLTHFEMMHSYWGATTLLILTLRLHFLFMIVAFDGS